ncbi:MAG: carbon storage regulator [Planctomycetes bacterium]|nr:carbon storage regulator [Planctomycetota bacterium]
MLVLSRKRDESICIGDQVLVTVVDVGGDKVRLGVTAPLTISVDRQEVRDAKHARAAAEGGLEEGERA